MNAGSALTARVAAASAQLFLIHERLQLEVRKLGFSPEELRVPAVESLAFELSRDPASGQDSLIGAWRDARGQTAGHIKLHADGTFYSEFNVVKRHPRDRRWFVEAVTAWGNEKEIKSDPQLLAALD